MSGHFRQSRRLNQVLPYSILQTGPSGYRQEYKGNADLSGAQTTTSYRSSGPESQRIDVPENPLVPFPVGDTGHEFDTVKQTVKFPQSVRFSGTANGYTTSGTVPACLTRYPASRFMDNFPVVPPISKNEANTIGTRFINESVPTAPQSNLLMALIETVREGLPAFPGSSLKNGLSAENLGSEWLNLNFGIKPLLSDIQDVLHAVINAPKILEQIRRDSGKIIRRRRELQLPDTYSTRDLSYYGDRGGSTWAGVPLQVPASDGLGRFEQEDRVQTKYVFTGAFQYYLDVGDDALSRLSSFESQASYLLGLRITPELLWNLAPWSWLVDWFAEIGPILGNLSAFSNDGLVLKYGYLQKHTIASRYYTFTATKDDIYSPRKMFVTRFRTERKERVRATPFGFGFMPDQLTGYQTSILGALAATAKPGRPSQGRNPRR